MAEAEEPKAEKKEQIVAFKAGDIVLDFFKFDKTKSGDVYITPIPDLSMNMAGKGSGLHFSFHKDVESLFIKSYDPLMTLKFADVKDLEKNAAAILEKIITPPVSDSTTYISVPNPSGIVPQTSGKRTLFDINDLKKSAEKVLELPTTNDLKSVIKKLAQEPKTSEGLITVMSKGGFIQSGFRPLTEAQISSLDRRYISENSLKVIKEYGGLWITVNEETIEALLKEMGVDPKVLGVLIRDAVAGTKAAIKGKEFDKAFEDSFSTLPSGKADIPI